MVVENFKQFQHLIIGNTLNLSYGSLRDRVEMACWGHDLIEDCRKSYNDVKRKLGDDVADMIYAVTNEKGKTRAEKANEKYYEGIRNTPCADFVKLCDRIANVQYSKLTKSRMFEGYRNENSKFIKGICGETPPSIHWCHEMIEYLDLLFENKLV
jgi:(p)ppGpp synthase/HD superfamily hydrolase